MNSEIREEGGRGRDILKVNPRLMLRRMPLTAAPQARQTQRKDVSKTSKSTADLKVAGWVMRAVAQDAPVRPVTQALEWGRLRGIERSRVSVGVIFWRGMLAVGMRRQLAPYDGKTQVAEGLWTGQFLDVAPPSSTPGSFAIRTLSRDPGSV
ncbi:uncharacterized protein PHACADRAFT_202163, partial [Phanerochaete carnosa HHB-10118-sp]